jgi:hypothetical protein
MMPGNIAAFKRVAQSDSASMNRWARPALKNA